jgi:hypothetical protein
MKSAGATFKSSPSIPESVHTSDTDVEESIVSSSSTNINVDMDVTWEYLDETGWKKYDAAYQKIIENAYGSRGVLKSTKVTIKSDAWSYEVDLDRMVQTNIEHSGHRERDVRRLVTGVLGV